MPQSRPQRSSLRVSRGQQTSSAAAQSRSVVVTAAWAGLASALVASVLAIVAVAVLWLPASGGSGSATSAIRAGILTFLAAVHGGVTVDGVASGFVPLGLTFLVVVVVWRATTAVAGAADEAGEDRPEQLLRALGVQSAVFALTCVVLAAASPLGSSSASIAGAFGSGLLLTVGTAGAAWLRHSALGDELRDRVPPWLAPGLRAAVAALAVYVAIGALLVAGSLVVHHDRVTALSSEVGGGWSGVPVLVLGVLAAPNAAIAAAGYLSGAGFAVGTATTVSLTGTTSGLVPAFPILGALPERGGSSVLGWLLAAITPVVAGAAVAIVAGRADGWRARWTTAGAAVVAVAVLGAVLAWQGGGGIGDGSLRAVGTSPWRFPLLTALWTAVASSALLGLRAGVEAARAALPSATTPGLRAVFTAGYDSPGAEEDDRTERQPATPGERPDSSGTASDDSADGRDHLAG